MLLALVSLALTAAFFLHLFLTWNVDYWLKLDVPFLEPTLLFGNIKDVILMKKTMGEVYMDIYNKLKGKPLGGFFKLRTPILMIRHPTLVGRVLDEDFATFMNNDIRTIRDADPILKMNPFLARDATWRSTRSVLTPCQSIDKIKSTLTLLRPICEDMIRYIKEQPQLSVEVKDLSGKFTTDVIASYSFGMESHSFRNPDSQFRSMTSKLFNHGLRSNIALLCAFYAPALGNSFKFRIIPNYIAEFFIGIVTEMCKYRVREHIHREDFLQELININKESEAKGEGTAYNYKQIAGHCMAFVLGGYSASCASLCFCLRDLAMNPDCQRKARQDVLAASKDIASLDYDAVLAMDYLDIFVSESLRMHPPIQTITRQCKRETMLIHGGHEYTVEEGTPVTVPVYALHMDPQYFPEPEKFRPERFRDSEIPRYAYLPFGEGPRICLAQSFAKIQLKAALAAILMNFEIEPRDPSEKLTLDPLQTFFSTPKGDVWLQFKEIS